MSEPKLKVVKISKDKYDALLEKETNTMYFVYDGSEVSLFFGEKNVTGASGGGGVNEEEVEAIIENYLRENPIETGATVEQASQINTNKTDITNLKTNKQDKLVSGTNIKTVGGQSLLGPGNISLPTVPAFKTINGEPILGEGNLEISKPSVLKDLRTLILGDSITAGQGMTGATRWATLLSNKYSWVSTVNAAGGISLSSYYYTNSGDPDISIVKKAESIINMNPKPDIVLVWGGHNDTGFRSAPLGTFEGATSDPNSFKGALRKIAELVHNNAPNAMLFVLTRLWTSWTPSTLKVPEGTTDNNWMFDDAIFEGSRHYGFTPINMQLCGINPTNKSTYTGDGVHPNAAGTELIVNFLSNELEKHYRPKTIINIPVTSVSLTKSSTTVSVNGTEQLLSNLVPSNATNRSLSWTSSNSSIVSVNATGLITGIAIGSAVITVTTQDGSFTATCTVAVDNINIAVAGISLNHSNYQMERTSSLQLVATITPSNATNQNINWTSSDNNVISVSQTGLVNALNEGSAIITATTVDGNFEATCNITAVLESTDPTEPTEPEGDYYFLESLSDTKHSDWVASSMLGSQYFVANGSNSKLALEGKTINGIYLRFRDTAEVGINYTLDMYLVPDSATTPSEWQKIRTLTIPEIPLTEVDYPIEDLFIPPGHSLGFRQPRNSAYTHAKASTNDVGLDSHYYDSASTDVATPISIAVWDIKIKNSDTQTVGVSGVTLDKASISIEEQSTLQLNATITPEEATNKTVVWSSSNDTIASVNQTGLVSALSPGSAVITVTTQDGSFEATCTVTVDNINIAVAGISLNHSNYQMERTSSLQLVATITPSNATNQNINWTSSDNNVISVSQTGLVNALNEGSAIITATTVDGNFEATCNITAVLESTEPTEPEGDYYFLESLSDTKHSDWVASSMLGSQYFVANGSNSKLALEGKTINGIYLRFRDTAEVGRNYTLDMYLVPDSATTASEWQVVRTLVIPEAPLTEVDYPIEDLFIPPGHSLGFRQPSRNSAYTHTKASTNNVGLDSHYYDSASTDVATPISIAVWDIKIKNSDSETVGVSGVTLDKASISIEEQSTLQLNATITPEEATNKTVVWSSSNDTIASVNQTGLVSALSPGSAVITVTTQEGSFKATCAVTVDSEDVGPVIPTSDYFVLENLTGVEHENWTEASFLSTQYFLYNRTNSLTELTGKTINEVYFRYRTSSSAGSILADGTTGTLTLYLVPDSATTASEWQVVRTLNIVMSEGKDEYIQFEELTIPEGYYLGVRQSAGFSMTFNKTGMTNFELGGAYYSGSTSDAATSIAFNSWDFKVKVN